MLPDQNSCSLFPTQTFVLSACCHWLQEIKKFGVGSGVLKPVGGGGGCTARTHQTYRNSKEISLTLLRFIISTRCKRMESMIGLVLCVLWRWADDCPHVSTLSSGLLNLDLFVVFIFLFFFLCVFFSVWLSRTWQMSVTSVCERLTNQNIISC